MSTSQNGGHHHFEKGAFAHHGAFDFGNDLFAQR
jgi:hypothetical protein